MTDTTCSPLIIEKMMASHKDCFDENGSPKNPDDLPEGAGCAAEFSRLANCCTNAMGTNTEQVAAMDEAQKIAHMKGVLEDCPRNE